LAPTLRNGTFGSQRPRLTDEAAALLGMSPAERESTDSAFGDLLGQFRRVEIQRMESVAPPVGWLAGAAGSTRAPGLALQ
jgi:hypothetical protein